MNTYTVTQTGDSTLSATVTDATKSISIQGDANVGVTVTQADDVITLGITPAAVTLTSVTTDNISEGSNLYYTNARADARISNNLLDEDNFASDSATNTASQQSIKAYVASQILTKDNTDEITEGSTNLYYTNARFDTRLGTKTTDNLTEGSSNLYYTNARFDTRLGTKTTDNVTEGSSNLYYTDARARAAISESSTQLAYNSSTGVLTFTQGDTDTVSEGSSNLYFTNARADARVNNAIVDEDDFSSDSATKVPSQQSTKAYIASQIATKDNTDEITEGSSNLYFTNARADARISNNILDEDNFASDSATNTASQQSIKAYIATQIATKDNSDEITEGSSNLYFTNARAQSAITASHIEGLNYDADGGTY